MSGGRIEVENGAEAYMLSQPSRLWCTSHTLRCARTFRQLCQLLSADLYRYSGDTTLESFFRHFVVTPRYKYMVRMRLCGYLKVNYYTKHWLYYIVKYILIRCRYKYGISIPDYNVIGHEFFINRFGGIYVHGDATIGSNVNFTRDVALGYMNRGERQGAQVIGGETFIGSGAKIIGHIRLGKHTAVGANAVVTKDFPEDAVVGGIRAKLLSMLGREGYISRKDCAVQNFPPRQ